MKKVLLTILTVLLTMTMQGQTYTSLWQQAEEAAKKDLPQTEIEVLRKIASKAEAERNYGQLMKAELNGASTQCRISPDSLRPAVERLEAREAQAQEEVLRAVYDAVLGYIYEQNGQWLDDEDGSQSRAYYDKALARPDLLAQAKALDFTPFVVKGKDSDIYDGDLLSVIAYEARRYDVLRDHYLKQGQNRKAMLMSSLMALRQELADNPLLSSYSANKEGLQRIDSLIACYADLPEVGEAVIERYDYMTRITGVTKEQRWNYLNEALNRYKQWPRLSTLRNNLNALEQKTVVARMDTYVTIPNKPQEVRLNLQGITRLTMHVYRVKGTAQDFDSYLMSREADYKKLQSLATELPEQAQSRTYTGHQPWEDYQDTLALGGLPAGIYLVTFETNIGTQPVSSLYHVTNLRLISQRLPNDQVRHVVVNATSGQPVKGAQLKIVGRKKNAAQTVTLTTDAKGECLFDSKDFNVRSTWLTTADDKYSPALSANGYFSMYNNERQMLRADVFTDRAIYRPGQTVHAAAIFYNTINGFEHEVLKNHQVTLRLRDANHEVVSEQTLSTDDFGTCAADFTLPRQGLTGGFSVEADGHYRYIKVEEYKRPTFEVEIPTVKEDYADGDTLQVKGVARTYSGVPVQGAKVQYRVERRRAFWWMAYSYYWNQGVIAENSEDDVLGSGEAITDADGAFTMPVAMVLPKTRFPMFYNIVVTADVTDQAGETHHGELSLPLGNRKTAISVDAPSQVLNEKGESVIFHLRNAAGTDLDADVRYRVTAYEKATNEPWLTAKTNTQVALPKMKSGQYTLEVTCNEDTLKHDFIVFSLDDKRPAVETNDWFYTSDTQFPNDGKPVTVQVGSSDKDVHIVYTILSGNTVIESGSVDKSNELINRKFTYREEYGNGLLLNFAWVKDGRIYTHQTTIKRPLPDKKLKMEWQTFRNRLTPGQQEEWTLIIQAPSSTGKNGTMVPAKAQLLATLYDKSLDQLMQNDWSLVPYIWLPMPTTSWYSTSWLRANCIISEKISSLQVPELQFNAFDHTIYPTAFVNTRFRLYSRSMANMKMAAPIGYYDVNDDMEVADAAPMATMQAAADNGVAEEAEMEEAVTGGASATGEQNSDVQVRENLQETAFFYPQLTTDDEGRVSLKFTLPESLTTWRFLGLAHTQDMMVGMLSGEAVAKKDVMIQPNVPRFVRAGDKVTISARVFNTGEQPVNGTMRLELIDPETEQVVFAEEQPVAVEANGSFAPSVQFICSEQMPCLLIVKCTVSGEGFSDGEQHYLPVLPNQERVTLTVPFTQTEPGTKEIDLNALKPQTGTNPQITVEYTNNPAWLMIQALPTVGHPYDHCVICQASAYYANVIGRHILTQNPNAKHIFEAWGREQLSQASGRNQSSLYSQLEKNQELKDLVLAETPWVADANSETEQRERLADFFDESLMAMRLKSSVDQLEALQLSDGSWSWWKGMHGSMYMTVEVCEMLVRLNQMTTPQADTQTMLDKAFRYLGSEVVKMVDDLKQQEKKNKTVSFPSHAALQWLYVCTLDGRQLPARVQSANDYLVKLLKKETRNQSIFDKAMTAIILNDKAYVKSLKEYTVYREDMGRYYDTPRALYSWRDYRIPTQVAAIEAIKRLTPEDTQTISEMQRWLLQEKRTQVWDTPVNSADAIYAFLNDNSQTLAAQPKTVLKMDGETIPTSEATAGIGYVKTTLPMTQQTNVFTAEKTSTGTSWGAVYMQFMQPTADIQTQKSGISVKREIVSDTKKSLKVGDRVKVRITIEADRDYDFVQVVDKRAACMEPVNQLSGYYNGYYCAPKDCATNYFFDLLAKGKHVIETEYYIDRVGTYETGTCTAGCAYSPEFRGTAKSMTITVGE